jgi:hypothetical protein
MLRHVIAALYRREILLVATVLRSRGRALDDLESCQRCDEAGRGLAYDFDVRVTYGEPIAATKARSSNPPNTLRYAPVP